MLRWDRLLLMSLADPLTLNASPLAGLLACTTPFLFFTGKGGVGKTSIAAATAVALAEGGARVLIVSTDPASNLDEVLGVQAGTSPTPVPVPGVAGLTARNIDPDAAAAAYRERVVGPYRTLLPAGVVAKMEEELSGSCTVEIAAFNEFVALLADPTVAGDYDRIVFDTAPTGHTLRLLTLPGAWTGFLQDNKAGVTCIGPISALGQTRDRYADAVAALRDPARTTLVLVTRPDVAALSEAARAAGELSALGVVAPRLVINGGLGATDPTDEVAQAWQGRAQAALAGMPSVLAAIKGVDTVPLLPAAPVGLDGLHLLLHPEIAGLRGGPAERPTPRLQSGLGELVEQIEAGGPGVVMTMGKGGVGKTTVAAAIPDPPRNLTVTRIDPAAETASYTKGVLATAGKDLNAEAYALLEEDLRSPCTEEVAVFQAFARTVAAAADRYVVIDTAPTGHTVLLLDSSRSFARQVTAQAGALPEPAARLLDTLTDAAHTRILLVTLPEATPVHEAAKLQADLARAGITPFGWVVNMSLAATTTTDAVLQARAYQERRWISEVSRLSGRPPTILGWSSRPLVGAESLAILTASAA